MSDRVGQQLGQYRLLRLLGQGGFAEVYLGEHIHLATLAAIKVLRTNLASKEEIRRFQREAYTIAHLEHPHIVRVLDFDVIEGVPFLVMNYAPNGTLRQHHPKGSLLPLSTIVTYVKQIADALHYAHDQHLIHRDIKPENMLLGGNNQVLLSDFGIALIAQSMHHQNTQEVSGTAPYMAPEQLQGKPRRASDQYALGIVVYEWICGDPPFLGSFSEMYSQHLFIPPSSLCKKLPELPPAVEKVVLTALAKDSTQRFVTIQAFATALEAAYQATLPAHPLILVADSSLRGEPVLPTRATVENAQEQQSPSMIIPQQSHHGVVLPDQTLRQRPQQGLLRRTLVLGLVGVTGMSIATGGMLWLANALTPHARVKPTPSTTPPKRDSLSNPVAYYNDLSGKLTIGIFRKIAPQPQEIFTDFPVDVDSDMVVIGGGGKGDDVTGAFLTASYPRQDLAAWLISSKDHIDPDPHRLAGFAIGLKIAGISRNELLSNHDVTVFSVNSETAPHPEATVAIPSDFVLLGGGFNVHWEGRGNLATASFPSPTSSWTAWTARSKDHEIDDPSIITTYAIGLRRDLRVGTVLLKVDLSQSGVAPQPTSTASLQQGFALTGGGAEVHWTGDGNLLWQLEPTMLPNQKNQQFIASSTEHDSPDPSSITTYALGIQIT